MCVKLIAFHLVLLRQVLLKRIRELFSQLLRQ